MMNTNNEVANPASLINSFLRVLPRVRLGGLRDILSRSVSTLNFYGSPGEHTVGFASFNPLTWMSKFVDLFSFITKVVTVKVGRTISFVRFWHTYFPMISGLFSLYLVFLVCFRVLENENKKRGGYGKVTLKNEFIVSDPATRTPTIATIVDGCTNQVMGRAQTPIRDNLPVRPLFEGEYDDAVQAGIDAARTKDLAQWTVKCPKCGALHSLCACPLSKNSQLSIGTALIRTLEAEQDGRMVESLMKIQDLSRRRWIETLKIGQKFVVRSRAPCFNGAKHYMYNVTDIIAHRLMSVLGSQLTTFSIKGIRYVRDSRPCTERAVDLKSDVLLIMSVKYTSHTYEHQIYRDIVVTPEVLRCQRRFSLETNPKQSVINFLKSNTAIVNHNDQLNNTLNPFVSTLGFNSLIDNQQVNILRDSLWFITSVITGVEQDYCDFQ